MVPEPVARVKRALTVLGAEDTVTVFDSTVPTAAAAAAALGCDVAAITNSLVFDLEGAPLLILASGAARVDVRKVAAQLGTGRIRRASPGSCWNTPARKLAAWPRSGTRRKSRTLLDESLAAHPVLWAGAGDHHSMFSISYRELQRITEAEEMPVR